MVTNCADASFVTIPIGGRYMLIDKHSQNIIVSSGAYEEERKYWLEKLEGGINFNGFPVNNEQSSGYTKASFKCTIPNETFKRIVHLSNHSEYAVYMIMLSGIKYLLYRYTDNTDLLVGMPMFKQDVDEVYLSNVLLNNILPIRSSLDVTKSFSNFLGEIKNLVVEADNYQNYPLHKIYEQLNLCTEDEEDLAYKTIVLMENIHEKNIIDAFKFDTVFSFLLTEKAIEVTVDYNAKLYTEEMMKQVMEYLFHYFREVTQNPHSILSEIEILSETEKSNILIHFNNTEAVYPKEKTIRQVFEEQVGKNPGHIAVAFEDQQLTYGELNSKANSLARVLRNKGVQADSIVGIMVERSLEMMIGIMGILKAGGAYLPISPDYPEDRINYMLEDSGTRILLTQNRFMNKLSFNGQLVNVDDKSLYLGDGSNLLLENNSHDLAYVIYTSGSTGKPKGVMIENYSVINRIHWMQDKYRLKAGDVILQKTPFTFDVSVWEIVWWFFVGASVCMLRPGGEKEPEEIVRSIEKNKITTMHFVPSMLTVFLHYIENCSHSIKLDSLKHVFASGEALNPEHANRFNKLLAGQATKLINLYGPTEATVDVSYFDCSTDQILKSVPIGKPIDNIQLYIVNQNNKLQPVGVAGELCIAGDGLARGYLNKPELTAEKFVENPFMPGYRMYRTGDLAKWRTDGNIEFLGRLDHQVKIRGLRIELGEIETELLKYPSIKETVVVAKEGQDGDKYLCAYIVAEGELTITELRDHLFRDLPDYMIPSYFVQLEKMPVSPNGKADRKALPEPNRNIRTGVEYVAPQNNIEESVVKVWQEILKVENVSIKDNFFSLGGDSIKAIQILSQLSQCGLKLEMRDLFQHPTIEALSSYITVTSRKIDQGIVKGEAGFAPMQSWFFEQSFTDKQHFNQAVMLYGKNGFEEWIIRKVFSKLVEHHDALRMVVKDIADKKGLFNRGIEDELYSIETVDLANNPKYRELIKKNTEEIQQSIDLKHGPLIKLGLFKTNIGDHLLIVIHHLVIDGVSWRIILQDLFSGYIQTLNNQAILFADKTNSFKDWINTLAVYANSQELLNEIEYWQKVETTDIKPLPQDKVIKERRIGENNHMQCKLTKEETEKLLKQVNSAYNTEVNDILLTALALTITEWAGEDSVLVNLEGHGREEIIKEFDISRTVGWFTSLYPIVLNMSGEQDLAYKIKTVKESMRQIPNKGIGYGILKYMTSSENKGVLRFNLKPEINFNYLGQFDGDVNTELFTVSDIPAGKSISPNMDNLYKLDINGIVTKGRFTLNFMYHKGEYKNSTIRTLAENFKKNLLDVIDHCVAIDVTEMTPSDFTLKDITIEGLEDLEDAFSDIE